MRAHSLSTRVGLFVAIATLSLFGAALPVAAAGHPSSDPTEITKFGSRAYFAATTAAHGRELWTSDGTSSGTFEFKDINPAGSSSPSDFTVVGDRLFFAAYDGIAGGGLWVSDGTQGGTIPLSEGSVHAPRNVGGTLFFLRDDTVWTSDGTIGGTDAVEAIPNVTYFGIAGAVAYQGAYYFAVFEDGVGWSLWSSDGTPPGTGEVAPLTTFSEDVAEFVVSGGLLFFNMLRGGTGGANPGDLWKSDGTTAGTGQVKDLYPPPDPEDPTDADGVGDLTKVAGTLFFSVSNTEVWKTNGTEAGTTRLKALQGTNTRMVLSRLNNKLMFSIDPGAELELWRSKGTKASTKNVHAAGPYSCSESAAPDPNCVRLNYKPASVGSLLFYASEGTAGIELWATDGTSAGTYLVKDIRKGVNSSRPSDLSGFGEDLLFVANNGKHGRELWISDGTTDGTKLLKDINPG